jgi:hypothetical protein
MNPREVEDDSWIRIRELELGLGIILLKISPLPPPEKLHKDQRIYLCDGDILQLHISHSIYSLNFFKNF